MDRRQFMEVATAVIACAIFPQLSKEKAITALNEGGIQAWGSRTLDGKRYPLDSINTRRVMLWIRERIGESLEALEDEVLLDGQTLLEIIRSVLAEAERIRLIHRSKAGFDENENIAAFVGITPSIDYIRLTFSLTWDGFDEQQV